MGKSKPLELPATPTQYTNPLQQGDMAYQSGLAHDLTSGNLPEWLQSTINPNNSANALSQAQGMLQPQFRDTLLQIKNQAAGAGALESSTFTDALARSQSDLNSQYQSIVSGQAINDANMANQNKLSLFGSGLNTLQQGIGNQQNDSNATNKFNLANYDNLVAQSIQNNQNANRANGWQQFGSMVNPLYHDYLQSQGINSVPGYGVNDIAKMASYFMPGGGSGGGFGNSGTSAGMSASNGLQGAMGPQGNAFQQYLRN